ncbi:hypothetical protein [Treponema sp.]|uniref:hypothetical protein n=1 Tax=Treponema sp. TaxID=166 RepID=UPI003F108C34
MESVVLAGASFIFGLDEIRRAFSEIGIEASFAEIPCMLKYRDIPEKTEMEFTEEISDGRIVVPLSEYWISKCIEKRSCMISERAMESSRSKRRLYALMGAEAPEIFSTVDSALKVIVQDGKKIIVKPDGLFSGYGIKAVDKGNAENLERYVYNARRVNNHALSLFGLKSGEALVTEYICGGEYSADVFYFKGRVSVVRVCRKEIVLVHDTPCTAVYQLVNPEKQITEALERWSAILFDSGNISFGQFDFIQKDEKFFLLDFAPRVGGGIDVLLKKCPLNVYAQAVRGKTAFAETGGMLLSQFNYLPTRSGKICDDNYSLMPGEQTIYKRKGDFVPECPSSNASRVASVIALHESPVKKEILDSLLIGEKNIAFWKK